MSSFSHVQEVLEDVYEKYKDIQEGEVASYIPELAKADPHHFGIAMVTVDGQRFSAGDSQHEFTIQSTANLSRFRWHSRNSGAIGHSNTWASSPAGTRSTPSSWNRRLCGPTMR